MGVDLNRSNAAVSAPPMGGAFSHVPFPRMEANVPPREVIRCRGCQLVQFRTASGRCRRCTGLLPLRLVLVRRVANPEEGSQTLPRQFPVRPPGPFLLRDSDSARPLIGGQLVRLRRARGLSQTRLAKLAGIPRSYVSRMENDHLTPGPRIASRLAAAVGVTIADLLARESGNYELLWNDPTCARLLSEFSRLEPPTMGAVLAEARNMLEESEVTAKQTESLPGSPRKPKVAMR